MDSRRRRQLLRAGFAAGVASLAGCAGVEAPQSGNGSDGSDEPNGSDDSDTTEADGSERAPRIPTPTETGDPRPDLDGAAVAFEPVATGFAAPLDIVAPDGTDRRFVVDRDGRIWEVTDDGRADAPLVDLSDRVLLGGERGLLGAAAHPDFARNGRLYVRYSAESREGTPNGYSHTAVLAELTVDPDSGTADAGGAGADDLDERAILEVPQPQSNHNAGALAFGPDGYLYVAFGDGGGANDVGTGHVRDWYAAVDGGNGQDVTENLLGSVLRIDVDGRGGVDGTDTENGSEKAYAIPADNPLVGRDGLPEQYAWGFRNPWRLSFHGRDCYVADVGQGAWEELNLLERGGNYGWNVREGAHCFRSEDCPVSTPEGRPFLDPVAEYPHDGADVAGVSIIGGVVADGESIGALAGAYVFADLLPRGRLFAVDPETNPPWEIVSVDVVGDGLGRFVLGFGRDQDGEVYVLTTEESDGGGETGTIARLVAP
ncbi:PQQ-dependent sugar dehydrogenase [Halobellus rufus]|uniref:PQQ-dependent sugar dehydrogenase n=1 Tax=Halobellus rufus TaxID=1448860 RepID=UPI000679D995|nr:PQQ-dependent sugar dehydrogenase [Halobellus rufus]